MATTKKKRSVSTRLDRRKIQRMEAIGKRLESRLGLKLRLSTVLEMCVRKHLPAWERSLGISESAGGGEKIGEGPL